MDATFSGFPTGCCSANNASFTLGYRGLGTGSPQPCEWKSVITSTGPCPGPIGIPNQPLVVVGIRFISTVGTKLTVTKIVKEEQQTPPEPQRIIIWEKLISSDGINKIDCTAIDETLDVNDIIFPISYTQDDAKCYPANPTVRVQAL